MSTVLIRDALHSGIAALQVAIGEDDPDFIAAVLMKFSEQAPTLLGELRDAVEAADRTRARRAAHTLKSNFASFGLNDLAAVCARLERDPEDSPGLREDLRR